MTEDIAIDSRIEKIIWQRIGVKSVRQISEEVGLPIEQVLAIRNRLLDGIDDLTLKQERQKLMVELKNISLDAKDRAENASDEFFAGMMNSSIAAMKTVLTELTRMDKADTSKIDRLNDLRVRELVQLLQEVVDVSVYEVSDRYGLDKDELFAIFNANLEQAASKRDALEL